jgi:dynein heavy chain
MGENF